MFIALSAGASEDEQQPIKDESNSQRSLNNPSNPGVPQSFVSTARQNIHPLQPIVILHQA